MGVLICFKCVKSVSNSVLVGILRVSQKDLIVIHNISRVFERASLVNQDLKYMI